MSKEKEELPELTEEQQAVVDDIENGRSVLITGAAGTGKSLILKTIKKKFPHLPITATTGIAAINVGGSTFHSWARIGLAEESAIDLADKLRGTARQELKKCTAVAIDEISMMSAELFDKMDLYFKRLKGERGNGKPFGGMQLILFGDFLQLPPVIKYNRKEDYVFAFQSQAWKECDIKVHRLTRIFRQEDEKFSTALSKIRIGELDDEVINLLSSRVNVEDESPKLPPVNIYPTNRQVDNENETRLAEIDSPLRTFDSKDYSVSYSAQKLLDQSCLAPAELKLKKGARVMLLRNLDTVSGLANGSTGTVESMGSDFVKVNFDNGESRIIKTQTWKVKRGHALIASREQLPLRLAWAITAHKAQGMTLDKIKADISNCFEDGQAYVTLSRVKSLDGLFLTDEDAAIYTNQAAKEFYQTYVTQTA